MAPEKEKDDPHSYDTEKHKQEQQRPPGQAGTPPPPGGTGSPTHGPTPGKPPQDPPGQPKGPGQTSAADDEEETGNKAT